MRTRRSICCLAVTLLAVLAPMLASAAIIESLDVQLRFADEPLSKTFPATLRMELVYTGESGEKVSGFRSFGGPLLVEPRVTSADMVSFNESYTMETNTNTINWSGFLPENGSATVLIESEVHHMLLGRKTLNALDLEWLSNWPQRIEFLNAQLVMPPGFDPKKVTTTGAFSFLERDVNENDRLVMGDTRERLSPGKDLSGRILFQPGIIQDYGRWRYNPRDLVVFFALLGGVFLIPGVYVVVRVLPYLYRGVSPGQAQRSTDMQITLHKLKSQRMDSPEQDQDESDKPDTPLEADDKKEEDQ